VVGEIERGLGFSRRLDPPPFPPPAQARRLSAACQLGDQRLWPEVLVDVDPQLL
jgi:hypothetical protein